MLYTWVMIYAHWRRIERLLHPDGGNFTLGPEGAPRDGVEIPLSSSCPALPTADGVNASDPAVLSRDDRFEIGAETDGCEQLPLSEIRTPFLENHVWRRLPAPSSLRIGESCATSEPEYRQVFGPGGSIQRCVEQFIEARFSPRKPLRSDRRDCSPRDLGRSADEPTDVCVVAGNRISHAA